MKTRDWLLEKLLESHAKAIMAQERFASENLMKAKEEILALKERISQLAPQKQFKVLEGSVSGPAAERTIQTVYSSKGVTTITL